MLFGFFLLFLFVLERKGKEGSKIFVNQHVRKRTLLSRPPRNPINWNGRTTDDPNKREKSMLCAAEWALRQQDTCLVSRVQLRRTRPARVPLFREKRKRKIPLVENWFNFGGDLLILFLFNQNWVTENNNLRGPGLRNLSKNDHQRLLSEVYGTCGKSARSDS
jgi:hypothetical protein